MKQPNLGYVDVKLDFACMHPAGCAWRVSLCVFYDLFGLMAKFFRLGFDPGFTLGSALLSKLGLGFVLAGVSEV